MKNKSSSKTAHYIVFVPPLCFMLLIFISSSIQGQTEINQEHFFAFLSPALQNFLHIPMFGLLEYLWLRSFTKIDLSISAKVKISSLITGLFGCLDELHQSFVPGRYCSLTDVLFDFIGMTLGIFLFLYLTKVKTAKITK